MCTTAMAQVRSTSSVEWKSSFYEFFPHLEGHRTECTVNMNMNEISLSLKDKGINNVKFFIALKLRM